MPWTAIREFAEHDVPGAGALLAQRHRHHRAAQPLLSSRYEDEAVAAAQVQSAYVRDNASGAVATQDGRLVGFLLGAPKPGDAWGPNVWVESAGQATAEPDLMRDLYAVAAARWVAEGRTAHYVLVPAFDQGLLQAWYRLAFGQQHAHGLRAVPSPLAPAQPLQTQPGQVRPRPASTGVEIRRATRADLPTLAKLDLELPRHQGSSPTFSAAKARTLAQYLDEWEADIDDQQFEYFVAELGGSVIGSAVGSRIEESTAHSGPARPDGAAFLGFAAVFPHARGVGAGRALGEAVLNWAAEAGFASVVTDWRVTNLLSSRAWPALGFAESFLRLHRLVGY